MRRNEAYKLCSINFANLGAKIMKTSQCTKKYFILCCGEHHHAPNLQILHSVIIIALFNLLFSSAISCHLPVPVAFSVSNSFVTEGSVVSLNILLFIIDVNTMAWN